MTINEYINELCSVAGPAGFEDKVTEKAASLLKPLVDEIRTDVMGNVIGVRRCGKENAMSVLLDAHIDEIGFVVTGIEEGFVRFQSLGGVDSRMLPATRIKFLTEPPVYGVVSVMPIHALPEGASDKPMQMNDMCIDVGMPQEQTEKLLPVGTPAVYDTEPEMLGNNRMTSRALDDRACFACILSAMEKLQDKKLNMDIYVMGSTQEEVGKRGATVGAFGIMPDYGIAVDVCHAATPDCSNWRTVPLGSGVSVSRGPNMNRKLTDLAIRTAEDNKIPYTINAEPGGNSGTNTMVIQTTHEGVATALFSLPLRYMHTPVEVISLDDCEAVTELLVRTVEALCGGETK